MIIASPLRTPETQKTLTAAPPRSLLQLISIVYSCLRTYTRAYVTRSLRCNCNCNSQLQWSLLNSHYVLILYNKYAVVVRQYAYAHYRN